MKMPQHNFLLLLDLKASFAKRHVLIQYSLLLKQCNVSQKDAKSSLDDRQWAALAVQRSKVPQTDMHLDVRLPGASGLGNQTSATVFGHGDTRRNATHIRGAVRLSPLNSVSTPLISCFR